MCIQSNTEVEAVRIVHKRSKLTSVNIWRRQFFLPYSHSVLRIYFA